MLNFRQNDLSLIAIKVETLGMWVFFIGERNFFATLDGKFIIKFSSLEQKNWPNIRYKVRWCTTIIFLWSIWGEEKNTSTNTLCVKKKCHSSIQWNVWYRPRIGSLVGLELLCWTVYFQLKQSHQRTILRLKLSKHRFTQIFANAIKPIRTLYDEICCECTVCL